MEYLGLIFEILFWAMGIYLYLFAVGKWKIKDPNASRRAEAFRQSNGWWIRLAALAIVAIMTVNIFLHIRQLLG
jgi:hypothetical protein